MVMNDARHRIGFGWIIHMFGSLAISEPSAHYICLYRWHYYCFDKMKKEIAMRKKMTMMTII